MDTGDFMLMGGLGHCQVSSSHQVQHIDVLAKAIPFHGTVEA